MSCSTVIWIIIAIIIFAYSQEARQLTYISFISGIIFFVAACAYALALKTKRYDRELFKNKESLSLDRMYDEYSDGLTERKLEEQRRPTVGVAINPHRTEEIIIKVRKSSKIEESTIEDLIGISHEIDISKLHYSEYIPGCSGTLKIIGESWVIQYCLICPTDLRLKPDVFEIPGERVDSYIKYLIFCWNEYNKLSRILPAGGEFSSLGQPRNAGEPLIWFVVGGYKPGLYVHSHRLCISTEEQYEKFLHGLNYAMRRCREIKDKLRTL